MRVTLKGVRVIERRYVLAEIQSTFHLHSTCIVYIVAYVSTTILITLCWGTLNYDILNWSGLHFVILYLLNMVAFWNFL